mmetsp:Transcript_93318/g.290980  ORF Transcript_93318/g.290980 Transcript_93318/m.290980 type:complete len:276 (+) Transcript_93318:775-1602(+)
MRGAGQLPRGGGHARRAKELDFGRPGERAGCLACPRLHSPRAWLLCDYLHHGRARLLGTLLPPEGPRCEGCGGRQRPRCHHGPHGHLRHNLGRCAARRPGRPPWPPALAGRAALRRFRGPFLPGHRRSGRGPEQAALLRVPGPGPAAGLCVHCAGEHCHDGGRGAGPARPGPGPLHPGVARPRRPRPPGARRLHRGRDRLPHPRHVAAGVVATVERALLVGGAGPHGRRGGGGRGAAACARAADPPRLGLEHGLGQERRDQGPGVPPALGHAGAG